MHASQTKGRSRITSRSNSCLLVRDRTPRALLPVVCSLKIHDVLTGRHSFSHRLEAGLSVVVSSCSKDSPNSHVCDLSHYSGLINYFVVYLDLAVLWVFGNDAKSIGIGLK